MFLHDILLNRLKRGCETMAYPAGRAARVARPPRRRLAGGGGEMPGRL